MVVIAPSALTIKGIHALFIRQRGVNGYMSEGMITGCLEWAMTYIYSWQPFPKLFLKAAAILFSIIVFHPFVDGNKRTAFESTRLFLLVNGYELKVEVEEGILFNKSIADGQISQVEEIAKWLQYHSKRKISLVFRSIFLKYILMVYSILGKDFGEFPDPLLTLNKTFLIYPD